MARRAQDAGDSPDGEASSDAGFGSLFGSSPADRAMESVPPAPVPAAVRALAASLPPFLHLGTSSWAYPGWRGMIYARSAPAAKLARDGLAAYAHWPLFRTVGLDRAFYSAPSHAEYCALAQLVPAGFQFLVKADQRVVRPDADARGETFGNTTALHAGGRRNPHFLDADMARHQIIAPAATGLGSALGPIVFQFPHLDLAAKGMLGGVPGFLAALRAFLEALPKQAVAEAHAEGSPRGTIHAAPLYAVEVRNRELLRAPHVRSYAATLAAGGAVHSYLQHPTVPSIAAQEAALREAGSGAAAFPAIVVRWMLLDSSSYEAASDRFEPFNELRAPDPAVRAEIAALLALASPARPGFAVCNNKAEGSAVLTVERLAAEIAAARTG